MKWAQLKTGSIDAGDALRVRLARRGDEAFLERMSQLSEVGRDSSRLSSAFYQRGIRAALDQPRVGFYTAVQSAYNGKAQTSLEAAIHDAVDAGTYDLVATMKGQPVGAVHMGPPGAVVSSLLALPDIHEFQVLSLMIGTTKLVGIAVEPDHQGKGVGTALVAFARRAADRCGALVTLGECRDEPALVNFYASAGFSVWPPGGRLNVWPIAGAHVVDGSPPRDPHMGPIVQTESGYRLFASVSSAAHNETINALQRLNPDLQGAVGGVGQGS